MENSVRAFLITVVAIVGLGFLLVSQQCNLSRQLQKLNRPLPEKIVHQLLLLETECIRKNGIDKERRFEVYNMFLALFQKHSTGRPFGLFADEIEFTEVRFLYLPSFQPFWYFEMTRWQDDRGDDIMLTIRRWNHDPERQRIIEGGDNWSISETVIRNYGSDQITPLEFRATLDAMIERGAYQSAEERDGIDPNQPPYPCIDGVSFYIEVVEMDKTALIRSECDDEIFQSRLAVAQPMLDLAFEKLPVFADDMRAEDREILGFETKEEIQ